MKKIMVITTVPNTAEIAKSSAKLATTTVTATATVTKAITKTISIPARTSFYSTTAQLSNPAVPSAVPEYLTTRVMNLMRVTGFNKSSLIAGAVQIGLGTVIIHGFKLAWNRLPVQSVPPGEDPRRWTQKVQFAYNFLKNAAAENERLRKDIEKARQEAHIARQNELFAEKYSFGSPMAKQGHSQQDNVLVAKAETDKLNNEQLEAEDTPLDAEPATAGPDPEDLLRKLMASDMAREHMAEQLKQLEESSQRERHDLQSEVARLKSEVVKSHQSNSELRGDLKEANQHADGLDNLLEYTEVKLAEEKEYVVELKELDQDREKEMDKLVEEIAQLTESRDQALQAFKEEKTRRERAEKLLKNANLEREKAEYNLFRQSKHELAKYNADTPDREPIPLTAPNVFRFIKSRYGIDDDPPQPNSPATQTPNVVDSSAALSEVSDSSTPSRKRKRSPKATKTEAMPNKRRMPSPEETYGDMASESESTEVDPVLPAPDKALDLNNVPLLARPDALAPPATPAAAPMPPAPHSTARRASSRLPIAAPTPGRDLRQRTTVNYTEGSRRSAQPQSVPETPVNGRHRAPSATPAPETSRRVTRSQSPAKRAPARR